MGYRVCGEEAFDRIVNYKDRIAGDKIVEDMPVCPMCLDIAEAIVHSLNHDVETEVIPNDVQPIDRICLYPVGKMSSGERFEKIKS